MSRRRGSGRWALIEEVPLFRGSTRQICGLWPFSGGVGVPRIGVPVGKHLENNVAVACDPITYFITNLISSPSMLILGKQGLGKSTLGCRIIIGLEAFGIKSLVLGDLKPDYVETVRAVGGQIITIGRSRDHLNILDHQYAVDAANAIEMVTVTDEAGENWWVEFNYVLPDDLRRELLADSHGRRKNGVESLINVLRRAPASEREVNVLDKALQELEATWHGPAEMVSADLLGVITGEPVTLKDGRELPSTGVPQSVRNAALDHGRWKRYLKTTDALRGTIQSFATDGALGDIFSQRTTTQMRMDRSMAFDVSSIGADDVTLQSAVLLACWNYGFGNIETHQILADVGAVKRDNYLVIMDEMWRPLRSGSGMIDRIDSSTRLNRSWGIGNLYITHTLADFAAVDNEADKAKAQGIAERCGVHVYFGLPRAEMTKIAEILPITRKEQEMMIGWSVPASVDQSTGTQGTPPGLGHCLIKIAGHTGFPIKVVLTEPELRLHNTNKRWVAKV